MVMILELHRQGVTVTAIARRVGLDRKTVRGYIAPRPGTTGLRPPQAQDDAITSVRVLSARARRHLSAADRSPTASRAARSRLHRRLHNSHRLPARYQAHRGAPVRGPLRDPAGPPGASRFRAFPYRVYGRTRRRARDLAVLARARPQPHAVGPLRAASGPADAAALPCRRI